MKYEAQAKKFLLDGKPVSIEPYGEGHINETYLVATDKGARYILQKINAGLFRNVERLMNNIFAVTGHIRVKIRAEGGDAARGTLTIVRTAENGLFLSDGGEFFRVYVFIENATAHQRAANARQFFESASAFGRFQNYLADFDASALYETIPKFHDTSRRFADFTASLAADKSGRLKTALREADFALARQKYCPRVTDLIASGAMPLKVTHNDTKLNNVMLDDATGRALAVIDLDTVMPGSSCYDFGDSIRFGCAGGAEDERDLSKIVFRADLFEAYTRGYLGELKNITKTEKENLAFSSVLMTYECGMRFLADYVDGDVYFAARRPEHNLDRARTQFKLVEEMEKALPEMEQIVQSV
jgi:N-acetylhexosamine 1-kinase